MDPLRRYRTFIRLGLAVVFLANVLTAILAPDEFLDIFHHSIFSAVFGMKIDAVLPIIISINDAIVAVLLFAGIATRRVAVWASIWIVLVMVALGQLSGIMEHVGYLAMSLSLALDVPVPQRK